MFQKYGFELFEEDKDVYLINTVYKTVIRYKTFLSSSGDYDEDINGLFARQRYLMGGDFLLEGREYIPFYILLHKVPFEDTIVFSRRNFYYRYYSLHSDLIKVLSETQRFVINGEKLIRSFFEIFFVDFIENKRLSYGTERVVKDFWSVIKHYLVNPPLSFDYYFYYFFETKGKNAPSMIVEDQNAFAYPLIFSKLLKEILPPVLSEEDEKYLKNEPSIVEFSLAVSLLNRGIKTKRIIGTILEFIRKNFSGNYKRAKTVVELSVKNSYLIFPESLNGIQNISIPVSFRKGRKAKNVIL